jgi:hypothetical protein
MKNPPEPDGFFSLGSYDLQEGDAISVTIESKDAGGNVHADAVQILPVP